MTTTTFIRREIHALERRGFEVQRYAVRRWREGLVDPQDIREEERTRYLLTGNVAGLFLEFGRELAAHPGAVWRGFRQMVRLAMREGRYSVRHVAYLLQAVSLLRWARADGVSHIHAHFMVNATAVAMLSRVMGGPTYSFTVHGPDEFDDARSLSVDDKLAHADFAVAISHYTKSQLLRFGGAQHADKIHIVHCGIDPEEFSVAPVEGMDAHTLVCVGRLSHNKGQVLIPEAVARLRGEFPALKVILVGDGEARADVEAAIRAHGVGAHVELAGWRANNEVRRLIGRSRALVLPTFAEGLPIVIMEALATGRPVISTYIAGIPELLDAGCGWIVPAGSVNDLADAMAAALRASPDEIARLGAEGRRRVAEGFAIDANVTALAGYFEALADGPARKSAPVEAMAAPAAGR